MNNDVFDAAKMLAQNPLIPGVPEPTEKREPEPRKPDPSMILSFDFSKYERLDELQSYPIDNYGHPFPTMLVTSLEAAGIPFDILCWKTERDISDDLDADEYADDGHYTGRHGMPAYQPDGTEMRNMWLSQRILKGDYHNMLMAENDVKLWPNYKPIVLQVPLGGNFFDDFYLNVLHCPTKDEAFGAKLQAIEDYIERTKHMEEFMDDYIVRPEDIESMRDHFERTMKDVDQHM